MSVNVQLSQINTPIAITAVSSPPTSWMIPVPTRFRNLGNRALRGDRHDLRQGEAGNRLNDGRGERRQCERKKQVRPLFANDVVDEVLRARREHEPRKAVDEHEGEADRERALVLRHELARLSPRSFRVELLLVGFR
jgi:hypothetical protein